MFPMTALLLKSFGSLRKTTKLAMSSGPPLHQQVLESLAEPSQCTYPETWWGKALTCSWYSSKVSLPMKRSIFICIFEYPFTNKLCYVQERRWMRFVCYRGITKTWFLWDQWTVGWLWWISQLHSCSLETKDVTGKTTSLLYLLHCKLPWWCSTCTSIIMKTVYDNPQGRIRSHTCVVKQIFVCLRCKQCSVNTFQNPVFTGVETWDEQAVAKGTFF